MASRSVATSDLVVVIPTRDRWEILDRTLAALAEQTVTGFRILVVVDGDDQSVPPLPDGVRVIQVARGGPGAARNAGVAATTEPYVLFLGDDMIPTQTLIERHLDRHSEAAQSAQGGEAVGVLGQVVWHPEVADNSLLRWIDEYSLQFDFAGIVGSDAGWGRFYSCNVSLPRALYDRAGGFDPAFSYYYEDLDLAYRLRDAGLTLRYEPAALAQHLHSYDEAGYEARLRGIAQGEYAMTQRYPDFVPYFANRFRVSETQPAGNDPLLDRFAPVYLDSFEAEQELGELKAYLGDRYDRDLLVGHWQAVDAEEAAAPDALAFYRTSTAYLYDLTVFAMSGTKRPYRNVIRRRIGPGSRLLDYGCGIGSDGLRFLDAGYQVDFADFDNPSVDYLRWRLAQRGLDAAIHDVEQTVPTGFEVVYCFDVIEHVDEPLAFLATLESLADLVLVNFLEPAPDDVHVHKPLPIRELLAHAANQGVVHYSKHYGRSHLVMYHSRRTDPIRRALGRRRLQTAH